jgi:hypothetical protein
MKFHRLIRESKLFWPSEILISDGSAKNENEGFFPTLNKVWNNAEFKQERINSWHEIMSWAIFCSFHKLACQKVILNDLSPIKFNDIDMSFVEIKFIESLYSQNSGKLNWPKQIRRQYKRHYS